MSDLGNLSTRPFICEQYLINFSWNVEVSLDCVKLLDD